MRPVRYAVALALVLVPATAHANPWDLFGFNGRAIAMGNAHTAMADDFTAVYYNPAALTIADEPGFGFGLMLARPALSFEFEKAEREVAELNPPSANSITFGAVFPMGGQRFRNRVVAGLALNVPTDSLLNGQALDPATPHWYMYQSLPRRIVATLGIAALPVEWLSIGAGVQILAGLEGELLYELDVVAGRFSQKSVTFDISPIASPTLGIEARPFDGLRVGASYRASIQSDVVLPVDVRITGVADLYVATQFNVQYTPHQLTFGIAYLLESIDLLFGADLVYAMWSGAPDPSVSSSIDVGGDLIEGTGLDNALDTPAPGQERAVDLAFRNTLTARFGAEQRIGPFGLRGGYAVRPSPAPQQTTGTNYVDATAHIFSLGAGVRFLDPLGALENPLIIDVGGALHYVPQRRYQKVDRNDPVGDFTAGGAIFVMGLTLRYELEEAPVSDPPPPLVREKAPPPAPPLPEVTPAPEPPQEVDELPEGDG